MEGCFRFEGGNVEIKPELGMLLTGFSQIVVAGTKDELAELLNKHPQRDSKGRLIWLLTSGMAVELATGLEREHHDLDIVVMDEKYTGKWEFLGTDNVTPGQYWAYMIFDPQLLEETSIKLAFTTDDNKVQGVEVEIVHPTIIMTQKLSNAFGRDPREKDLSDAVGVIKWWEQDQKGNATWIKIVQASLNALPNDQRLLTQSRIENLVPKVTQGDK